MFSLIIFIQCNRRERSQGEKKENTIITKKPELRRYTINSNSNFSVILHVIIISIYQ